jgi:hypothetical protein
MYWRLKYSANSHFWYHSKYHPVLSVVNFKNIRPHADARGRLHTPHYPRLQYLVPGTCTPRPTSGHPALHHTGGFRKIYSGTNCTGLFVYFCTECNCFFLQRKSIPTGYAIFPKWSNSASKMSEISPPVGPFCHFDALNRIWCATCTHKSMNIAHVVHVILPVWLTGL